MFIKIKFNLVEPTTDATLRFVRSEVNVNNDGYLESITPLGSNEAYILQSKNMENFGGRTIVFRDCGGEIFDPINITELNAVPYLLKVPTTFILLSIADLEINPGYRMDQVLNTYINTLLSNKINPKKEKRKIIFVLTKGDLLNDLPKNIQEYLINDSISDAILNNRDNFLDINKFNEYIRQMREIDKHLKSWIDHKVGGRSLIALANDNNIDHSFCIISCFEKDKKNLDALVFKPRRILDPLFFALFD